MPNPKTGTVTMDVGKAVRDAKAGKLEYRTDRGANVHVAIGKKSFGERELVENYAALDRRDRAGEAVRPRKAATSRGITLAAHDEPGDQGRPCAHARDRGGVRRGERLERGRYSYDVTD